MLPKLSLFHSSMYGQKEIMLTIANACYGSLSHHSASTASVCGSREFIVTACSFSYHTLTICSLYNSARPPPPPPLGGAHGNEVIKQRIRPFSSSSLSPLQVHAIKVSTNMKNFIIINVSVSLSLFHPF